MVPKYKKSIYDVGTKGMSGLKIHKSKFIIMTTTL